MHLQWFNVHHCSFVLFSSSVVITCLPMVSSNHLPYNSLLVILNYHGIYGTLNNAQELPSILNFLWSLYSFVFVCYFIFYSDLKACCVMSFVTTTQSKITFSLAQKFHFPDAHPPKSIYNHFKLIEILLTYIKLHMLKMGNWISLSW